MAQATLTSEQRKGVKALVVVLMLVLVQFLLLSVAGRPIADFGTELGSAAYLIAVYIPLMVMCVLIYRRVQRR